MTSKSQIAEIVAKYGDDLLPEWLKYQRSTVLRRELINDVELREQSRRFLELFRAGMQAANGTSGIDSPAWADARNMLADVSHSRAKQGFTPSETGDLRLLLVCNDVYRT